MKRIAIVIGCDFPVGHPSHLPGVYTDFNEFKCFLRSDFGGGWSSNEIISLAYPTIATLNKYLRLANGSDLVWVYFSGHGFQRQGQAHIQIQPDTSYPIDNLWVNAKRQVVMVDACRNEIIDDSIPFLGDIEEIFPIQHTQLSRQLFANYLSASPQGQILLQSSISGQTSLDTHGGGLFTKTVLSQIKTWGWSSNQLTTNFLSFGRNFPNRLNIGKKYQNPQIQFSSNSALQIPLAVNPALIATQYRGQGDIQYLRPRQMPRPFF